MPMSVVLGATKGGFEGLWSGLTGKQSLFPLDTLILIPETLAQFVREERN
jgi:hypothetical protein